VSFCGYWRSAQHRESLRVSWLHRVVDPPEVLGEQRHEISSCAQSRTTSPLPPAAPALPDFPAPPKVATASPAPASGSTCQSVGSSTK
jgi:hypothetical protein